MKVLYILHIAEMHGSIISLFNTIEGVKQMGIDPVIVCPEGKKYDKGFMKYIEKIGVKYIYAPIFQSVIDKKIYRAWTFKQKLIYIYSIYRKKYYSFKVLSNIIRDERPSIIHTGVGVVHEGFWAAKRYGIPHVFHIREYQDKDFGWIIIPSKKFFCRVLKESYVITITEALKKYFDLEKSNNAITIYNGIYSQERTSLLFPKENYFLCASRISKEKGLDDVILAFADFCSSRPNYRLLLAGDGDKSYIERLKALALARGCSNNIFFLGMIDNVYDYMQKARALIVGSYNEGFGRMTAEAAFAGCIIVGRNTGGTKEIMDMIGGYRFQNHEELIASMNSVAELPELEYRKKAEFAQMHATDFFSTEKNIENTFNLYKKIESRSDL